MCSSNYDLLVISYLYVTDGKPVHAATLITNGVYVTENELITT